MPRTPALVGAVQKLGYQGLLEAASALLGIAPAMHCTSGTYQIARWQGRAAVLELGIFTHLRGNCSTLKPLEGLIEDACAHAPRSIADCQWQAQSGVVEL